MKNTMADPGMHGPSQFILFYFQAILDKNNLTFGTDGYSPIL